MSRRNSGDFDGLGIGKLEEKLAKLVRLCEQLKAENIALRQKQTSLLEERSELVDKNEIARKRVESILAKLKKMEPEV